MNETSSSDGTVSMRKPSRRAGPPAAATGRPARPPVAQVPPPLTINLAAAALLAMVVGNVLRWLFLLGNTPTLNRFATKANHDAKKPDYTPSQLADAVGRVRSGAMINAAIFGIALLLLAYAIRRTRSASGTRWAMLIIFVYTLMPVYVIPTKGLPVGAQAAGILIGVGSIAALVLVFVPPASQKYFRACKEANTPEELRGQTRPGLGSLFGSRRTAGAPPARGGGLFGGGARRAPMNRAPSAATPPAPTRDRPASAKAKAKVRSESDAVAKGAELARSRAKASKSRRTPD